ncbi:hypothetical protein [Paenibacillus lactis]|uniref:hypothetical protein n=1 Tax=Paenibacillus lactis TaxID=228574 RepID=UPI001B18D3D0|nr:hypothetical protein [Paenibacillus lactis]GIO91063.1 hypothetical protein J31TS3_22900 [Paenibacillus lactis]
MTKRKNIVLVLLILSVIVILIYRSYTINFTNEGIINKVIDRDGYSLSLETKQIPVEIFIKPEWIAFNLDERKELKIPLLEMHNTNILLDNVWNRGNDIYFSFTTTFHMKYKAGKLLYNGFLNEDGTFTSPAGELKLYDQNMNEFPVGQIGTGPGSSFSFGIQPEEQKLISEGFYVMYSGFNLYNYYKR